MKRACSKEQIEERKSEIMNVVNQMFDTMDYQDISMKTISEHISIARSSLYCYYQNKEEIMLDILQDDYLHFMDELIKVFSVKDINHVSLAEKATSVYMNHLRLLKIISLHLRDIEEHCGLEKLIEFKRHFVGIMSELEKAIESHFSASNSRIIFNALLMLTHSLYPMISPHENQVKAMKKVGMALISDPTQYCQEYLLFLFQKD